MAGNPVFGKKVRELREVKLKTNPKFTLRQFAAAVGISPTFLSKVERGEFDPPAADKIMKITVPSSETSLRDNQRRMKRRRKEMTKR